MSIQHYYSLSSFLKKRFGEPVRKITLDAGFGCPNRDGTLSSDGCIYCNERGSGTGFAKSAGIAEQLENGIAFLSKRFKVRKFIAYLQSFTNTYAPLDQLRKVYSEALGRDEVGGLAIGTRPDCVDGQILDMIKDISRDKLIWIEYGLQSIHKRTLNLINRKHEPEDFLRAVSLTRSRSIPVVAHVILGLPGETRDDMLDTIHQALNAGIWGIKLHPLYVVENTKLAELYRAGLYVPLEEDEAIAITMEILRILPSDVVIHRLTSDPHPEELLAPKWMIDKKRVREKLMRALSDNSVRQGDAIKSVELSGPHN